VVETTLVELPLERKLITITVNASNNETIHASKLHYGLDEISLKLVSHVEMEVGWSSGAIMVIRCNKCNKGVACACNASLLPNNKNWFYDMRIGNFQHNQEPELFGFSSQLIPRNLPCYVTLSFSHS
jgi:hypothetical protein